VLIELFARSYTAEALRAIIGSRSAISLQRGAVDPKWYKNHDRFFFRFVTVHAFDRQTEFSSQDRVYIPCMQRGKNEKQVAWLLQTDRAAGWVSYGLWPNVEDWNRETIFTDYIDLYFITTATYFPAKKSKSAKNTQNKGYYAVQSHPRSSRSIPIESPYATSCY